MTSLRFGIIGVGNIAPVHAAAIRGTPDAELVAVATHNPERGRAFVAEHGGTWHSDYRDLLARDDVDVVTLCTPHDFHAPMTSDAAATGKHVLCEKPMARNVAECDAMLAACERAGVALGVIFQGRFESLAHQLKAGLDRLGRLLWVSSNTIWYRTDEYYRSGPWRGKLEHGGGGASRPMDITAAAHTAQFQDFAMAIRERRRPAVDGHEGRRSVELVEAIYRSARTNAPVSLPPASVE
jgi:predicted dehydrogenase